MPPYVKVQGTTRAPFRVNGQKVTNKGAITLDLGDPKTRLEYAHHVAIGRIISVGSVAPAVAGTVVTKGGVVTPTTSATVRGLDVTAGTTRVAAGTLNNFLATTVAFGAADPTNPRVDLVIVSDTTGAISVVAGTAGVIPAAPAAGAGNTALAAVYIPATAVVASWINDVRPLPPV